MKQDRGQEQTMHSNDKKASSDNTAYINLHTSNLLQTTSYFEGKNITFCA